MRDAVLILRQSADQELRNGALFAMGETTLFVIAELQRLADSGDWQAKALLERLRLALR